jgi:hypothetical protein
MATKGQKMIKARRCETEKGLGDAAEYRTNKAGESFIGRISFRRPL